MRAKRLFLFFAFLISACTSAARTAPQSQIVDVYSTAAAAPWLNKLYDCAAARSLTPRVVDSPFLAQIQIRIGEPDVFASPAYQIGEEEILMVVNRESPIQSLTLAEAQALFAEQGRPSVQVWVYASGEDVQKVFDQFVMSGRSVTSSARLAVNPQQMSDILSAEKNAIGILPRHWKVGTVRDVFSAAAVPVLALIKPEPNEVIMGLITCLQK